MQLDTILDAFIHSVKIVGYEQPIQNLTNVVRNGVPEPPLGYRRENLREWLNTLSEEDRNHILFLVSCAVEQAVFNTLVFLDGDTARVTLDDKPIDFSVNAAVYSDITSLFRGQSIENYVLSSARNSLDLHDLFLNEIRR
jgi:hypothetical protein